MQRELSLKEKSLTSNTFIKMDVVYSFDDLASLLELEPVSSSLSLSLEDFFNLLVKHEGSSSHRIRYGVVFTFLLDEDRKDVSSIVSSIVTHFDNLPYFCYKQQKGAGTYLVFYFCERYYYPDGKECVYLKDVYQDKKTGHLYPSKMTDDCVLIHKKGDVKPDKMTNFSLKKTIFCFSGKKHFNAFLLDLKKWYRELLEDLFNTAKEYGVTFKKYIYNDLPRNFRRGATVWNDLIRQLEQKFDEAYFAIDKYGRMTEEIEEKFFLLYKKYQKIIKEQEFRFYFNGGKRYFTFKINLAKFTSANEAFVNYFERDISKFLADNL